MTHFVDDETIAIALSKQLGLPYASPENKLLSMRSGQGLATVIPEPFARRHVVMPLFIDEGVLAIATANPTDNALNQSIRSMSAMQIQLFVSTKKHILSAITAFYEHDGKK